MKEIRLLSQETIDKIAAGEVVERPSSVVKELVENSIDAGANAIAVEIRDGGISMIRVTDNGEGIDRSQVGEAFVRHATSKITDAKDLDSVRSLGFRGEALSSISAVGQVELITKRERDITGVRFTVNGGVSGTIEDIGAPQGSTFIVRNLFYNTPARKKFLKSAATEAGYISDMMEHLALSRPDISFKLIVNGQVKLHTSGNGRLKDVIFTIYGKEITSGLIEVKQSNESLTVEGYIGKPAISRGNRNFENYFVDGRYVKSRVIMKAIEDAYGNHLMQHRYPFTVLFIGMPEGGVDVNVHPAKQEVRFADNVRVYETLRDALRDALEGRELIPAVSPDNEKQQRDEQKRRIDELMKHSAAAPEPFEKVRRDLFRREDAVYTPRYGYRKELSGEGRQPDPGKGDMPVKQESEPAMVREGTPVQTSLFDDRLLTPEHVKEYQLIGQVFGTYWIVQFRDSMYLIDQHAAHEKVIYERLVRAMKEKQMTSQQLAVPIIVTMTLPQTELFEKYRHFFEEAGFEVEHFGGREYAIRAVPDNLYGFTDGELFIAMLDSLNEATGTPSMEFVFEKLAGMACKAAIKGNHRYSVQEADALIGELLQLDNPYNCPHGRPTIIMMSKTELERKFRRIVS